ncbi:response regulator [Sporosalibacterium faouarense]|uniref:response regulator n=1 Tax=Sporosalibacterium faouarense TaxID=516123 RepID=UPI00192C00B4|nr:response regulator [Sporosalibacterium faouarense]
MKFYIIDDDFAVIKNLEHIIEKKNLGDVIGYSTDGIEALGDVILKKPDIVLVDLLMPNKDGIDIVNEIRNSDFNINCIMISQVSSKSMISKAYNSGIEFFINKPINVIEVTKVIKKVSEKIHMQNTLKSIKSMFNEGNTSKVAINTNHRMKNIKIILNKLGVLGEKGGKDILAICEYIINSDDKSLDLNIKEICETLSQDNPKAMEQRIRRTISRAMTNIANLGIEDYMNDSFVNYSSSLFNFEDVKSEMDYIRGKKKTSGKTNVKKFINGIILHSEIL